MTELKKTKDLYTIRDVTHDYIVTVHGRGQVCLIGLGVDGNIRSVSTSETTAPGICVGLLQLSIAENGGMVLGPVNLDLTCTINKEDVTGEINLISGVPIEVADRTLRIYQGGVPSRKLPLTPGTAIKSSPPPKPRRDQETTDLEDPTPRVKLDLPPIDPELLTDVNSTDKLAQLAGSFLTKQINQYTDTKLSAAITDQIFCFLQEVAGYQRAIIVSYINEISQSLEEMPESERDRPLHKPSVRLLVELLRQIMDPLSHVVLSLQLLRTFSHFPENLVVMVNSQATPAVLGCMAVYLEVTEIQQYGLDILAKIATYRPKPAEKIPLRETALEMILRSIQRHQKSIQIVPPGCRTLVNLTTSLQENLDSFLLTDLGSSSEVEEAIERYDSLLRHIFQQAVPIIQSLLQEYPSNLDVTTEGRRFLYNYSKMTQFSKKKSLRAKFKSANGEYTHALTETLTTPSMFLRTAVTEVEPAGILRKEDQRTYTALLDRKVHFADDKEPLDSMTSSGEDSDLDPASPGVKPQLVVQDTVILSEEAVEALKRGADPGEEEEGQNGINQDSEESETTSEDQADKRFTSEMLINLDQQGDIQGVVAKCGPTNITIATSPSPGSSVSIFCPTETCPGHQRNSEPICQECTDLDGDCILHLRHDLGHTSVQHQNNSSKAIEENLPSEPVPGSHKEDKNEAPEEGGKTASPQKGTSQMSSYSQQGTSQMSSSPQGTSQISSSSQQGTSQMSSSSHLSNSLSISEKEEDEDDEDDYTPMNVINSKKDDDEAVHLRKSIQRSESKGQRYSVSDVSLCTKVIRLQVSHFISSLVFGGGDAQALSIIDKPLYKLLEVSEAPEGLLKYVRSQYQESKTLMDLDTAFLISVIDAIRYRSLFHDLVKKSVLEVVSCMFGRYGRAVLELTVSCLVSLFQNERLGFLLADQAFLGEVKGSVIQLCSVLQAEVPSIQELRTVVASITPLE